MLSFQVLGIFQKKIDEAGTSLESATKKPQTIQKKLDKFVGIEYEEADKKLLTDIMEMPCMDGKLYASPIMDCFKGEIVALEIRDNMRKELCVDTLQ